MGIIFQNSGLQTTVQDLGRTGYQKDGFSVSGVMDRRSARLANLLVNNPENEAVLEYMLMGPTIQFTSPTFVAVTGGDFDPKLNGEPLPMYTAVFANTGDVLTTGFAKSGMWGYMAFSGKLDVPVFMGSRSTNLKCGVGGFKGRKIEKNDQIWFRSRRQKEDPWISGSISPEDFGQTEKTIRVVLGQQQDYFTQEGIDTFLSGEYQITEKCDRMGYRLEGPEIAHKAGADIISDGIPLGAIQVPSHGMPIIMLADRQTTGGYTKIGTVISTDIPKLVQSKMGVKIHFRGISVEEAQQVYRQDEKQYAEVAKLISGSIKKTGGLMALFKKLFHPVS